jgi:S-methylmethionine-dependent homocysteine/selenocysteine methylase
MTAYERLEQRWQAGRVVVLDGGIGSELERLGFPRDRNIGELWGVRAVYEQPGLVREVHRRYAQAGADVLTAATWRADSLPEGERSGLVPGPPGRWRGVLRRSVELVRDGAHDAGREECAVAFSVWLEPMGPEDVPEMAAAIAAAEPDLILVETMETIPADLAFPAYETLLATGLPLWVSYRWTPRGPSDTRRVGIEPHAGTWQAQDGDLFGRAAARWEELGIGAVLVNCLPRDEIPGTLPYLRGFTSLPLGAYPNVGLYLDPGWQHDESTTPEAYLDEARCWVEEGATIVGGCCGTTPEHIAALAKAFGAISGSG